jgi:1-acyl-sn-glycerol-3-phosphate acyltransferase
MIIKAKHNPVLYGFFKLYSRFIIKKHFNHAQIIGEFKDKNLPILLISNHISWWDGFWALYLNLLLFKRKFHFMMLEDQLRKHWYFNYAGGFSVKKKSRSVIESLLYAGELLNDNKNIVLIFPQGAIYSQYNRFIRFEKGIDKILSNLNCAIQIIMLVNLTDYFSNKKPVLYNYIKEYEDGQNNILELEKQYQTFYLHCLELQSKIKS